MKIAYLTNVLTNDQGIGDSVHVSQVAKRLLANGHTLYTNLSEESDKFVKMDGKEFYKRGTEIDLFYVRICGNPRNDELTFFRCNNYNAPCIWEINSPLEELRTIGVKEWKLNVYNKKRKKLAKMVNAALCVSLEMEEYAKSFLNIKNTFLVPNGADPYSFSPQKKDNNLYDEWKFKLLWVGSTQYRWQGINIIKEVAKRLSCIDNNVLFLLTGSGADTENLHYLGRIPYSYMPKYMASADLGLCIYDQAVYEEILGRQFYNSPLKLFDYMASGLAVIGSNLGQIKTIIEENRNGLLTDNSLDDIVDKIMYCKHNKDLLIEMGKRGRQAVIDKYNWDHTVSRIEEIITNLRVNTNRNICRKSLIWDKKDKLNNFIKRTIWRCDLNKYFRF